MSEIAGGDVMPSVMHEVDRRGVAIMTLNRPAKGNAFDPAMRSLFVGILEQLASESSVRMLVLRGNGRHFCAGSDISTMGTTPSDERIEMLLRLDAFPKPVLAVVHGACIGAGLGLICCADVVIADTSAFFSVPEVRLGIPPLGLMPLILRSIGFSAFRRYALTGERWSGEEALRLGLVHQLCRAESVGEAIVQLTDQSLRGGPEAIRALKQSWGGMPGATDMAELLPAMAHRERDCLLGQEAQAGISSAREKRDPPWYRPDPDISSG
jgi:methylglutaconyl-CoA hydratase